jgi:flagellar biosynthesis/type III secretory pathway M-ring protein FliF/YscJ
LKTIRDLVAGVTGFNAERGDQLIVETLPFERSLKAAPPPTFNASKPVKNPPWLDFANKYRDLWAPVGIGLAVLLILTKSVFRFTRRRQVPKDAELPPELEAPSEQTELSPTDVAIAKARVPLPPVSHELADRILPIVKRDPAVTANVLRMWLQESRVAETVANPKP